MRGAQISPSHTDMVINMITIDLEKAKEIKKNQLRQERAPMLESLDVAWLRAIEANDEDAKKEIIAEKNRLRNITNDVGNVESVEQLKNILLDSTTNKRGDNDNNVPVSNLHI